MLFTHPDHPGKGVRLAYCMNAFPADTLEGILEGLRTITVPLRERLSAGKSFGVGLYVPAAVVVHLDHLAIRKWVSRAADDLKGFLEEHGLEPFTFNAFPYGRFHSQGLKEGVFQPDWTSWSRVAYTFCVAWFAAELARGQRSSQRQLSISTHTGMHSSQLRRSTNLGSCHCNYTKVVSLLAGLEEEAGLRTILALEAEPRANCNDSGELARFRESMLHRDPPRVDAFRRHLGTCLDTCHAAVEFEPAQSALDNAVAHGAPIGKIQYTSAVVVRDPARNAAGREQLFAMDEPRYLHQVTGRGPHGLVRAGDLPELIRAWCEGDARWRECDEWRCHFHVPVDLERFGAGGLETTRAYADEVLALALASPERWGTDELHVEIETYTWSVLPREARGAGEIVDGLEREYRHVLGRIDAACWRRT